MEREHESIVFGEYKEETKGYIDDFRISKGEGFPDLSEKHVYPGLDEMERSAARSRWLRIVSILVMCLCWLFVGLNFTVLVSKGFPAWGDRETWALLVNLVAGIMLIMNNLRR